MYHGPLGIISQQRMRACKPIPSPLQCMVFFYFLALVFTAWCIILLIFSYQAKESKTFRYDNVCPIGKNCQIRFHIDEELKEPVYLYFRMENYYQNYRQYVKSRDNDQLMDKHPINNYDKLKGNCYPKISLHNKKHKKDVFLPCGLIAWSYMNDTFAVRKDNAERTYLKQHNDDIAWNSDVRKLFKNIPHDTEGVRIPGIQEFTYQPFIVWMRTAALPSFYKLAKVIKEDMKPGTYRIIIANNYDVSEFDGKKFFRFSTVTWMGGRNRFLGWAFLCIAAFLFAVATLLCIKQIVHPRKLGDASYLDWNNPRK